MKICFVAPADNYHTRKWCKWFADRGHSIYVLSFVEGEIDNAEVSVIDVGVNVLDNDLKKIKYLFSGKKIRRMIDDISPDIVSVHYASSYGTAVALSGYKEYILSVWGMDVYDFPQKSMFHRKMIEYSLHKANWIFSTSNTMSNEVGKYSNKKCYITPFGVDMSVFSPIKRKNDNGERFVIGTVKSLTPKYGIDYLLKACAMLREKRKDINIYVRIAGKGNKEEEYKQLARLLNIDDCVEWLGFISQEEAAEEWANMDVAVVPSVLNSESFGVSAIEAEACGTAVVISDVPGLMETTLPGSTSIVVKRKDEYELCKALEFLYDNKAIRDEMGRAGRDYVKDKYDIDICFGYIESLFEDFVKKREN